MDYIKKRQIYSKKSLTERMTTHMREELNLIINEPLFGQFDSIKNIKLLRIDSVINRLFYLTPI